MCILRLYYGSKNDRNQNQGNKNMSHIFHESYLKSSHTLTHVRPWPMARVSNSWRYYRINYGHWENSNCENLLNPLRKYIIYVQNFQYNIYELYCKYTFYYFRHCLHLQKVVVFAEVYEAIKKPLKHWNSYKIPNVSFSCKIFPRNTRLSPWVLEFLQQLEP